MTARALSFPESSRPLEPLLSVAEVAELLGMTPAWVRQHASGRRKPKLPAVALGEPHGRTVWKFRRAAIEQFIAAQER